MTQSSNANVRAGRGKRRDPSIDRAVIRSTQRNLATHGYHRMSVDNIAAEAGTTKATVYKRWSSKADLATAAVYAMIEQETPPETGATLGDLIEYLNLLRGHVEENYGMGILGALLAEESYTPELIRLFRERILQPRRLLMRKVLERAAAQGELKENVDLDDAVGMLVGSYYGDYIAGLRLSEDWAERMVRILWSGIGGSTYDTPSSQP